MTNLPAALRERLQTEVPLSSLEFVRDALARDGTEKALFNTADGRPIEAVVLGHRDGRPPLCRPAPPGWPLPCPLRPPRRQHVGRQPPPAGMPEPGAHLRPG